MRLSAVFSLSLGILLLAWFAFGYNVRPRHYVDPYTAAPEQPPAPDRMNTRTVGALAGGFLLVGGVGLLGVAELRRARP